MFDVSSEFEDLFNGDCNDTCIEIELPANIVNGECMAVFFQLIGISKSWQKIHSNVADSGIMLASIKNRKSSTYKNPA